MNRPQFHGYYGSGREEHPNSSRSTIFTLENEHVCTLLLFSLHADICKEMHRYPDAKHDDSTTIVRAGDTRLEMRQLLDQKNNQIEIQTIQSDQDKDPAGQKLNHKSDACFETSAIRQGYTTIAPLWGDEALPCSSCLPSAETSHPASTAGMPEPHGPANTTPPPVAPAPQRLRMRRRSTRQETVRLLAELEGLIHPKQVLQTNLAAAAVASRFRGGSGQGSAPGGESAVAARCGGGVGRARARNEVLEEAANLVWKLVADDAVIARTHALPPAKCLSSSFTLHSFYVHAIFRSIACLVSGHFGGCKGSLTLCQCAPPSL
jgi:hypothetical protein